jgi:peptidyl-prolyl cis-trans isomerase D
MTTKKKSGASKLAVWVIVGLLMFGMIGFGAAGLNGTQRNLGKVGDKIVSISSYSNSLQGELNQFEQQIGRKLTMQEVQSIGIDQQALSRVINTRALDQLASDLGISAGNERVLAQILEIPAFMGLNGEFDRASYTEVLKRNNLNESGFETSLREDSSRELLQKAVLTGIKVSPAYSEAIVAFTSETRDFSWIKLTAENLKGQRATPKQVDLVEFHAENEAQFTTPAAKSISYIWLTPDMIVDEIEISDAALKAIYERRSDEFNQLPARLVERLVYASQEEAKVSFDGIQDGTNTFEDAVKMRGLELQDVDLGDVSELDLGLAGSAVFALTQPGLVGPLETDLGPAIFRVNALLSGNIQTFEMVKDKLHEEAAIDAATEEIAAIGEDVDDLLASGATLEDVSNETAMKLEKIDWHVGYSSEISDFEEFQSSAAKLSEKDFPELKNLNDNSIFALRLDGVIEPALQPLETVRPAVITAWTKKFERDQLQKLGEIIARNVSLDRPISKFGFGEEIENGVARDDFIDGTPPALVLKVFDTKLGTATLLDDADGLIVLIPRAEYPANFMSNEVKSLQEILGGRIDAALSQEVFQAFSNAVRNSIDVDIDQATVRAVNSNLLGGG